MDFVQSRLSERSDSQLSLGSVLERICESVSTCSCIISVHDCIIINPRRACAARVTVVGLCVC